MIKTKTIKVNCIKNEEIIMAITMIKIIITTVLMTIIIIRMLVIRIKIGNQTKIYKIIKTK